MKASAAGLVLIGAAAAAAIGAAVLFTEKSASVSRSFFAMDTSVSIKLWGKNETAAKACEDMIKQLDSLFDRYNQNSDIYKLNSSGETEVSEDTIKLFEMAKQLCQKYPACDITAGELTDLWDIMGDPKVPDDNDIQAAVSGIDINALEISGTKASLKSGKIDLGSCAKGYACDRSAELLKKNGVECAVVSFGSSVLFFGEKPKGERFSLAIRDPYDPAGKLGTLTLDECFVSTSGGYERYFEADGMTYSHIFDLKTGRPSETDLISVTVVGKNGMETDIASTAVYIEGTAGLEKFMKSGLEIVAVDKNRNVYISHGLKDSFKLENNEYIIIN